MNARVGGRSFLTQCTHYIIAAQLTVLLTICACTQTYSAHSSGENKALTSNSANQSRLGKKRANRVRRACIREKGVGGCGRDEDARVRNLESQSALG